MNDYIEIEWENKQTRIVKDKTTEINSEDNKKSNNKDNLNIGFN